MRVKSVLQLTQKQIDDGMKAIRAWYEDYPDDAKDRFVIVSGAPEDCWTPKMIMDELEKRAEKEDWGKGDIPEMVLESISKSKKYVKSV